MKTYGQTLEQSYSYLKAKRPSISFNEHDAARTMEVERMILGARASGFQLPVGKFTSGGGAGGGNPSFAAFMQHQHHQHGAMVIDQI